MAKRKESSQPSSQVQDYLSCISSYEREFKKWESRADRIIKRYRDEDRPSNKTAIARFNILWSNVQTLVPAVFSRLPQPDVSRRFRDQDQVGRVAALILERALDFEIQHYVDYRASLKQSVYDRFLPGRGTLWARYEPHFKAGKTGALDDGVQITEDTSEAPVNEELDYECAPLDYVHWKDFGHDVARTWEEVTRVWRKVYMSEDAVTERFGADIAKKIPYDSSPEELKRSGGYKTGDEGVKKQACVIELWDKSRGIACWFSKSMKEMLDEREDPLGLQEFFPCPRPLYSTLTNESLVPVPDFALYQDQAKSLDILADRIDGLCKMLQLKGVYDGSADSSLARLFTEGENGTLMPVKNWASFAEKAGLKGQIDVYDLTPLVQALKIAIEAVAQQKEQVYEITGISDIIRGQTEASETATAQQIKGQYASLRLRSMQDEVAQYATDALRLKAQIICCKFDPKTIAAMAAVEQLMPEDQQHVYVMAPPQTDPMTGQQMPPEPIKGPDGKPIPLGPAMKLLIGEKRAANPEDESPNPLRSFRIDVAADTLVQIDEQREKQDRLEMLQQFGAYLKAGAEVAMMAPPMLPLILEVGKFGLTAFKVGKQIEGTFDAALDQMKQLAQQPKPPDPAVEAEKAKAQAVQQKAQLDVQVAKQKADIDMQKQQGDLQMQQQQMAIDQQMQAQDIGMQQQQHQMEQEHMQTENAMNNQQMQQQHSMKTEHAAAAHAQKMKQASQMKTPARKQ